MSKYYRTGVRNNKGGEYIHIATICYGDLKPIMVSALNKAAFMLLSKGYDFDIAFFQGECHVDDARNYMVAAFLKTEATHLMFIDADVNFSPDSILKLAEMNVDVVGGIYPKKEDNLKFPFLLKDNKIDIDDKGRVEVAGLPGGFTLYKREVMEKLYARNKPRGHWDGKAFEEPLEIVEIFKRSIHMGKRRTSGDYDVSRQIAKAGFKQYVLPSLTMGHTGDKTWTANLQDHVLSTNGTYMAFRNDVLNKAYKEGRSPTIQELDIVSKSFNNSPFCADGKLLSAVFEYIKGTRTKTFFELGSGITTIVAAASRAEVISIEDSPYWAQYMIEQCGGLEFEVPVPLLVRHRKYENIGEWYDADRFVGMLPETIGVLLCDGPKRSEVGIRARALPICPALFNKAEVVIIDDVDDADGMGFVNELVRVFGFTMRTIDSPRRPFAIGMRK